MRLPMQHKLTTLLLNLSAMAALLIHLSVAAAPNSDASATIATNATDKRWSKLSQPVFHALSPGQGILDGPIRTVVEDNNGFIWLLESGKLWRWDAHQLVPVVAAKIDDAMPVIQSLARNPLGQIWVGTNRGLYVAQEDKPGAPTLGRVDNEALNQVSIEKIAFDNTNQQLFLATSNAVFAWQISAMTLTRLTSIEDTSNRIHVLHTDKRGNLWVGTTRGLFSTRTTADDNLAIKSLQPFAPALKTLGNIRIASLTSDSQGRLWVGTAKAGLFVIDHQGVVNTVALPNVLDTLERNISSDANPWLFAIHEIRPGVMWLGTFGQGIIEYHIDHKSFKRITHHRLLKNGLRDNNIWSFFRDSRGFTWVGTGRGVIHIDSTVSPLTHLPGDIGAPHFASLVDEKIHAVMAAAADVLWLGTARHGIEMIHPQQGIVKQIRANQPLGGNPPIRMPAGPIELLSAVDERGTNIYASSSWLTITLNTEAGKITASPLRLNGRASDAYTCCIATTLGSNNIKKTWLGGPDGLWRMTPNTAAKNIFEPYSGERRVTSLFADGDQLWAGTWYGVKKIDVDTDAILPVDDARLNAQFITIIKKDKNNTLWVGTADAGLFYQSIDKSNRKQTWTQLSTLDGLPSNTISAIEYDNDGNIWVSTKLGIARIEFDAALKTALKTYRVTPILLNQGAAAAPYLRNASARNGQGEIIFGGTNGITIIDPTLWREISYRAPLVVTNLSTNGETQAKYLSVNDSAGRSSTVIDIPADNYRFTIDFAALDYRDSAELRYRYRLIGLDDKWTLTDAKNRSATFTSLTPKTYTMEVQYANQGYDWADDKTLSITVNVAPKWFQQRWFKLLAAALITLAIYALYQWRLANYRQRERILEEKVAERTEALTRANQQLTEKSLLIEAASLTDPLTNLRNRRYLTQHIDADVLLAERNYSNHSNNVKVNDIANDNDNADLIFYLIDLDNFKRVNDRFGHAAGDAVLIEMRHRLARVFRESDFVIRWGGEEFLAVARHTNRANAGVLAERIREAVTASEFNLNDAGQTKVTCSIGFAAYPFLTHAPSAINWRETVALADAALYRAKHNGRNMWVGLDAGNVTLDAADLSTLKASPEYVFLLKTIRVLKSAN
jgi:diguanylate cyclase (GGDEF)-like protein